MTCVLNKLIDPYSSSYRLLLSCFVSYLQKDLSWVRWRVWWQAADYWVREIKCCAHRATHTAVTWREHSSVILKLVPLKLQQNNRSLCMSYFYLKGCNPPAVIIVQGHRYIFTGQMKSKLLIYDTDNLMFHEGKLVYCAVSWVFNPNFKKK